MIQYTDWTDFTELHGKSIKKSVFIRARPCNPCSKCFNHGDSQ